LQQAVERFADAAPFIPSASAAQFSNLQQYEGQTVSVSGKITLYRGKPEIIVTSPAQISAQC
jgi:DNA/RNA endonuclease YhcR with UshA esterase domain